jgi:hypothetical protein
LELVRFLLQCFEPAQASALVFQFPFLTPKKRGHKWVAFNDPSFLSASGQAKVFVIGTHFLAVFFEAVIVWHWPRGFSIFTLTPRPQRPPLAICMDLGES